ncbi:MAG: UPF0182 family protein [Ruminococcaceae bacterium]|nr:UPF0182 family protein [Oscillospiraceae bacterium]
MKDFFGSKNGGFNSSDFGKEVVDMIDHDKKKKIRKWIIIIGIILLLGFVISPLYRYVMEYWQIQEIGPDYTSVFWTNLLSKVVTQSVGFILIFVLLLLNVFLVRSFAIKQCVSQGFLTKKWPYVILCFVLALFVSGKLGDSLYQKLLMAWNAESFGIVDPLFSQDVGYYMFLRPFLINIVDVGKALLLVMLLLDAIVYFFIFMKKDQKSFKEVFMKERKAMTHLSILAVAYFLLTMLTFKFSSENLLFSSFGSQNDIFGAGYVQATVWRSYYSIAPYIALVSVLLIVVFLWRKKYILSLLSVAILPVALLVTGVIAWGTESLVVNPNERNMQTPYIAYNMEATNRAYGLNAVSETEFVPKYDITKEMIEEDDTWLAGTRITDFGSTLTAYNQLQFLRKYYTFNDVDVAPYELDGKLNVVFLAPREMNKENLEDSAKSYANQIFRYTHGFGVVASPVNRVTGEGQPEFLIKDIPPKSTGGMPEITQPRIYYGEMTNDYVIVGGNNQELDYSEGLQDVQFTFDGATGVKMDFFKKLMFSWYYKDYRMLFSGNISSDSKILINRNVLKRVERIAPFIEYDDDPYMIISDDGKLYWIINGYTTSKYYPYAQPYQNVNYIRNSVTAIVDAYTGDVKLYLTDENDPVGRVYRKIYPDIFSKDAIPEGIASHIRVPEYMFKVQSQIYQRYHVKDAGQFYDRADVWDIASEKYQDNEIYVEPYYNIMQIDGQDEMVIMIPYVVQGKHNMVGLLVQRNAPGHYGELMLYRFPKNQTIYGPMQIENRVDNDPDISREMTLWSQGGSSVIRGNMLVVPYRSSLLYVEPIYITSKNNASLPELKRIVVSYGDVVVMEPTLEEALRSIFGKEEITMPPADETEDESPSEPPATEEEIQDLTATINGLLESYDRFKTSAAGNDWANMGQNLAELDEKMEQLREHRKN